MTDIIRNETDLRKKIFITVAENEKKIWSTSHIRRSERVKQRNGFSSPYEHSCKHFFPAWARVRYAFSGLTRALRINAQRDPSIFSRGKSPTQRSVRARATLIIFHSVKQQASKFSALLRREMSLAPWRPRRQRRCQCRTNKSTRYTPGRCAASLVNKSHGIAAKSQTGL